MLGREHSPGVEVTCMIRRLEHEFEVLWYVANFGYDMATAATSTVVAATITTTIVHQWHTRS